MDERKWLTEEELNLVGKLADEEDEMILVERAVAEIRALRAEVEVIKRKHARYFSGDDDWEAPWKEHEKA